MAYHRAHYLANRRRILAQQHEYNRTHRRQRAEYCQTTRVKRSVNRREYYLAHRAEELKRAREQRRVHRAQMIKYNRTYYRTHHVENNARCRKYYWAHRGRILAQQSVRNKARRQSDPQYKLAACMRSKVSRMLKGIAKSAHTLDLLGCSLSALRSHLERQFRPGMTWANYGPVWHVDHVRPCVSFDLTDLAQQRKCFHFSNLQPLFARENLAKGAKTKAGRLMTEALT